MGFAEMKKIPTSEGEDGYPGAPDDHDAVEIIPYPSDSGAIVYVYFDGDRFRDPSDIDAVMADYKDSYPDTDFQQAVLLRKDLPNRRYFVFSRTEREFMRRGHAAEFDQRRGNEGPVTTAYLSAQKSILHVQALVLARILDNVGATFFGGANQVSKNAAEVADTPLFVLAPLFGEESVSQGEAGKKYALVDWQGLRLGRDTIDRHDHAHFAFSGTPNSWFKSARAAIAAGFFGWHPAKRMRQQIALELSDAGLTAFFGAQPWRDCDAPVTAGAVLTWQSQILGSLRKLVWQAEAEEGHPLLTNQLMKERQALHEGGVRRNPIGSGRLPAGRPETAFRDIFAKQVEDFAEKFAAGSAEEPAGDADMIREENVSTSVDERDIVIGALYGCGVALGMPGEKPDPVYELAWWLAHLRQTGESVISDYLAHLFEAVQQDPRTELTDLLHAALSDDSWARLREATNEVDGTNRTIVVRYVWGDLDAPWAAVREGSILTITGPLLYFPVTEATKWVQLSKLLAANEEFLAPPAC
ncbi:hypothetical protein [Devosia sp. A369]